MKETILLFNFSDKKELQKLKMVLIPLKIRIKSIDKKDYLKPVGFLADVKEIEDNHLEYDKEELDNKMMILSGLSGSRIDLVLTSLKRAGLPKINYKAVLTAENQYWSCIQLYEELKSEHSLINGSK